MRPISSHLELSWLIEDVWYSFWGNFSCRSQHVVPSRQDSSILPVWVVNLSVGFDSSCPLTMFLWYLQKLSLQLPTNATVRGECDKSIQEPYISLNWQTMEGYRCNFTMHFVTVESETLKPSTEGRWAAANLILTLNSTNDGMSLFPVSFWKEAHTGTTKVIQPTFWW